MNINFKKAFGFASVAGAIITGIASVGKEMSKFKEENPKKDPDLDGHTPSPEEAAKLAETCPEAEANTKEQMIEDVIEETLTEENEEEENK